MTDFPYDPAQEKEHLSAALSAVYKHLGTAGMAQAYEDLVQAVTRAEQALSVLTPRSDTEGMAFRVHVRGLGYMHQVARDELVRVPRFGLTLWHAPISSSSVR